MLNYVAIVGGIFLIFGAYASYKGQAQTSIMWYFFADVCLLIMGWIEALRTGNWFGVLSIAIGMAFGVGVWFKMNRGIFHKTLNKKNKTNIKPQERL